MHTNCPDMRKLSNWMAARTLCKKYYKKIIPRTLFLPQMSECLIHSPRGCIPPECFPLHGWIILNYVLIGGLSNTSGVHSYVTHCKNWTNHAKVRGIFKTLTSLDRVKANQNGTFLYFWGDIVFETCFFSKQKFEKFEKFQIVQWGVSFTCFELIFLFMWVRGLAIIGRWLQFPNFQ